jgi:hypothetical protein
MAIQDADLEYDPADLLPMWRLIEDGHADVVYAHASMAAAPLSLFSSLLCEPVISTLFSILYNQSCRTRGLLQDVPA